MITIQDIANRAEEIENKSDYTGEKMNVYYNDLIDRAIKELEEEEQQLKQKCVAKKWAWKECKNINEIEAIFENNIFMLQPFL